MARSKRNYTTSKWRCQSVAASPCEAQRSCATNLNMTAASRPTSYQPCLRTPNARLCLEVRTQYQTLDRPHLGRAHCWRRVLLALLSRLFYSLDHSARSDVLVNGSRRVAGRRFRPSHRICTTHDEMAELADAMNDMTARFQAIRDDLDQPGPGTHQASRPQRAVGQRRLSGGRRGPRNQQSAGLDRHVRRIARKPHAPRCSTRRSAAESQRPRSHVPNICG